MLIIANCVVLLILSLMWTTNGLTNVLIKASLILLCVANTMQLFGIDMVLH